MARRPEEVIRSTVEQNGGEYVTDVPNLLAFFGRQQLTDQARQEMREALLQQGVFAEPDLLRIHIADKVRLFLVDYQTTAFAGSSGAPSASGLVVSLAQRLRPRTWKGWTIYAVAALFIIAALAGESEETQDSRPAAEQTEAEPRRGSEAQASNREDERSLRREREALRKERARLRRARAQARRERAQARRERARIRRARAARRRRARQLEAQAVPAVPETDPAASCHPSYDPCLDPNASDYDCAGGSGDGPEYTGFVTVKGADDYDLDSDGDGTGCE
jgi:hypothetical protein